MDQSLKPTLEETPDPGDIQFLNQRLHEHNLQHARGEDFNPLSVFVRDADGEILGGLTGGTFWDWLHIDVLWLSEELRGSGHGRALLQVGEKEAVRRGCHSACVETHDFQALPFYQKAGYTIYGQLTNFPRPYTKYYLYKRLVAGAKTDAGA